MSTGYTLPSRSTLTHIFNFWHLGTLALTPERQSARMSEIRNVGQNWMALNTFKCYYLTPLHFKGLMQQSKSSFHHWSGICQPRLNWCWWTRIVLKWCMVNVLRKDENALEIRRLDFEVNVCVCVCVCVRPGPHLEHIFWVLKPTKWNRAQTLSHII